MPDNSKELERVEPGELRDLAGWELPLQNEWHVTVLRLVDHQVATPRAA